MPTATATPKKSPRALATERCRSLTWRVIYFLGSLKLALLLLATIALACAVATFCESSFDSKIARAYIYKAPWFTVWLGVLCANLLCVTITRWPWQRKHLGFVITHYGIITLLAGAVIGSRLGFEGNVTLHKGEAPLDRVVTSRSVIQVENPTTGTLSLLPFDSETIRPSERWPKEVSVPDSRLKILVDGASAQLATVESLAADPKGSPGIAVEFTTKMMGQHLSLPFLLEAQGGKSSRDFFGLAQASFLPALPKREPIGIEETQIVFTKFAPVIESRSGFKTGITLTLSPDGRTLTAQLADGRSQNYVRADIQGKPQQLGAASFTLLNYWPDFVIENGKPRSASMFPKNPAVLVRVDAPRALPKTGADKPLLEMAPTSDGVAYQLSRGGYSISSGTAKIGEPFALGWADWTATIANSIPQAKLVSDRQPAPDGQPGPPGFRARLIAPDGTKGPPRWIGSGDVQTLTAGDASLRLGYGLELLKVPFTIGLKSFEVPRVEGTETPSNFIANVEFQDYKTGARTDGVAQMNHPASWPGGAFAITTGLNYKFSQAEWNPEDLDQTTLQVLYDPGWLFKWVGSLAICVGIFIMFYLRPKKS
ncbi:MAG TPA: hypothetical protein VNB29_00715 [Chthoniobacterales bacterium]|nr:hypothetical protein [Chthoniobacterales bacterium]